MALTTRIKGCKGKDIEKIAKSIIDNAFVVQDNQTIDQLISAKAFAYTCTILTSYDIISSKSIINVFAGGNIFQAIVKSNCALDMTNELMFYRHLALPYIYDIVHTKIHSEYFRVRNVVPIISNPDEIKECSICLSAINSRDLKVTRCNHCFHKQCINQWISRGRRSCPNCRTRMI
jgi:hypothetical protein